MQSLSFVVLMALYAGYVSLDMYKYNLIFLVQYRNAAFEGCTPNDKILDLWTQWKVISSISSILPFHANEILNV